MWVGSPLPTRPRWVGSPLPTRPCWIGRGLPIHLNRGSPLAESPIVKSAVKTQPDRYRTVTPYLIEPNAAEAIAYYQSVFGAVEELRMPMPGGKVGHAELRIGDTIIMLADEFPEMNARSPKAIGGTPLSLMLYVGDADAVAARAVAAGAKLLQPVKDQFYGDRSGTIEDPFGHRWTIATHVEDVSEDEMKRRLAAMAE